MALAKAVSTDAPITTAAPWGLSSAQVGSVLQTVSCVPAKSRVQLGLINATMTDVQILANG